MPVTSEAAVTAAADADAALTAPGISQDGPSAAVPLTARHDAAIIEAERRAKRIRRVSRMLFSTALVMVLVAVALSIAERALAPTTADGGDAQASRPAVDLDTLEKKPVELIPGDVTSYQILSRQVVPGTPEAAETSFRSYTGDYTFDIPVRVYVQVRATPSTSDAQGAAEELLLAYTLDRRQILLGKTVPATIGLMPDMSSWIITWTSGQYVLFVKSFFDAPVPADDPKGRLEKDGLHVARCVDLYVRTGEDGTKALTILQKEGGASIRGDVDETLPSAEGDQ